MQEADDRTAATPSVERVRYIGKETDRRWEQGEDMSMIDSELIEYSPNETAKLRICADLAEQCRRFSIRELAKLAGVSDRTVKDACKRKRLRKSTAHELSVALNAIKTD